MCCSFPTVTCSTSPRTICYDIQLSGMKGRVGWHQTGLMRDQKNYTHIDFLTITYQIPSSVTSSFHFLVSSILSCHELLLQRNESCSSPWTLLLTRLAIVWHHPQSMHVFTEGKGKVNHLRWLTLALTFTLHFRRVIPTLKYVNL